MRLILLVSAMMLAGVAPVSAETAWLVDLSRPGAGSTNVVTDDGVRLGSESNRANADAELRMGFAVYSRTSGSPANTFAARVRSSVPDGAELAIDVRGRSGGQWTEWVEIRPEAPGVLPVAAQDFQVRVMLSAPAGVAPPVLAELAVTPSSGGRGTSGVASAAGLSYRVFATREGLVGGTTANGHKIVPRDHFVALPSRRGLSARHSGDYSVRVCADNGRCEWAPTWDVGPWNTRDDYWAAPGHRQEWRDLPQGKPASQAAYQDGYNNGKDQFGREVANPAGIDLADGTFWDGLKLKNNSWVTVTYQWTGTNPAGHVRTRGTEPLNVRTGPNSQSPIVGFAANHAQVRVECVVPGEHVVGTQGGTNAWYRLAPGMFVSAAYVAGGAAGAC
jgi:hypothetical protein